MDEAQTIATVAVEPGAVRETVHDQYHLELSGIRQKLEAVVEWGRLHPDVPEQDVGSLVACIETVIAAQRTVAAETSDVVPSFER